MTSIQEKLRRYSLVVCQGIKGDCKAEDIISYFFWTTGTRVLRIKIVQGKALLEYSSESEAQTSIINNGLLMNDLTMKIKCPAPVSELGDFSLGDWIGSENLVTQTTLEGVQVPALPGGRKHLEENDGIVMD